MKNRSGALELLSVTTPVQNTNIRSALFEAGYGFQSVLRFGDQFFANPSPDGRGCREAAGEGTVMKIPGKTSKKCLRYPSPGPLARATLSRWERDSPHLSVKEYSLRASSRQMSKNDKLTFMDKAQEQQYFLH